ncbi:MAG: alanine racemase [Lachnospiraceae bacterium]|nr:alanine racemase [Lachnospiraceae bacterium]
MALYERVAAYIDLDAVHDNLKELYKRMRPGAMMIAVIKADGYGHGALEIARETEDEDFIFGFAVATVEEALELREGGIKKPIILLGYTFPESYADIVKYEIRPAVFRKDQAKALSDEAVRQEKEVYFHLAVDTGMMRIGVKCDDSSLEDVRFMMTLPNVVSEGIFTHFARADEPVAKTTEQQIGRFRDFIFLCEDEGVYFSYKHCSNSAGMIMYPEANMDLARAGITMYGMWPSDDVPLRRSEIKSALELKSHIVYIKNVAPGSEVSYGGTYVAINERRIATIPVGYGDGFPRSLSNRGYVLIRGKYAPILGRICMDQFMVDVTNIPDAAEGDTVTLLGRDGECYISAEELGRLSGRFNYEFTCDLGKRIPRVFIKKGEVVSERYPF